MSQPPTPPIPPAPPATPFDAYPPHPDDFGFYVSFRLTQSLQKNGPDSWGLYLRESSISSLSSYLISRGCNATTAWNVAHEFVLQAVELPYLADCTLTKFDHFGWLFGGNPQLSTQMVHALQNVAAIGAARAYQLTLKSFGKDSPEVLSLRTFRSNQWKSDFAYFFLQWFSSENAYVLKGGLFSMDDLMATIKDVLVTTTPKKSPIGTALPIHYIP